MTVNMSRDVCTLNFKSDFTVESVLKNVESDIRGESVVKTVDCFFM